MKFVDFVTRVGSGHEFSDPTRGLTRVRADPRPPLVQDLKPVFPHCVLEQPDVERVGWVGQAFENLERVDVGPAQLKEEKLENTTSLDICINGMGI